MSNSVHEEQVVLIVDDTPENIDILSAVLSKYKRKIATNGERALKIVQSDNPPDIILLDVMMPGMDGFEVCRILQSDIKTKNIPIIFITAKSEVEDETKGLELGAVDFITKPISPPIVLARVKNHLELKISRTLLEEKNEELAGRNKYITDSINYAKRIQSAILPSHDFIKDIFPEHFIIFKPKDIVSGDFYWVNRINNKRILAVSDCTGHGVPGAFMSMIGNTLLNEIINEKGITDPAEILNNLDKGIIDELRKEEEVSTFDGMDIGICVIEDEDNTLEYAGAFRSLIFVSNMELFDIKGVKKSIGDKSKNRIFEKSNIALKDDMVFYMTSDGFIDQHNEEGIKYGSKKMKQNILKYCNLGFEEQRTALLNDFTTYKGNQIQRDDVTFIGFKI